MVKEAIRSYGTARVVRVKRMQMAFHCWLQQRKQRRWRQQGIPPRIAMPGREEIITVQT
jgi:hypothetical protein